MERHYFDCECDDADHTIRFTFYHDAEDPSLNFFLSVQLPKRMSFWQRAKRAARYIFGYDCKYGHWDTTIFKEEDLDSLIELFTRVKKSIPTSH